MAKASEKYSNEEAQRRFEAALRGGLNTPPQHRTKKTKSRKAKRKKK